MHTYVYTELEIIVDHSPFSNQFLSKSNLLGKIHYTFSMGNAMIVYSNVTNFNETNF